MNLELHPKQIKPFLDQTRHRFVLAGRRGGKTTLVRESLVEAIYTAPYGAEVFYIGPTLQDAADIMWEPMQDRLDELEWEYKPLISKRRFEFSRRRKLYIIGAEKIRRIRGHPVFFVALDEIAFYDTPLSTVWKAVRPALSDYRGRALVTTTPNGKGTPAYDFYLQVLKQPEDWKYFYWHTRDNPFIDPDEIEDAKREMDERSFRQEWEATWESFEGLAYYNFEENTHIKRQEPYRQDLPLDLLLDFNVNPTTLLIAQFESGQMKIRKEYSQKNSSTVSTIRSFCQDHRAIDENGNQRYRIRIFGDAAGHSRASQTGFSNYHYITEALQAEGFQYEICVPGVNPAIVDRVMHLNAWLKNYYGESRIEIDPSCTDLIRDLSSQELDGRHPSEKYNLGHKVSALGYYVWWMQLQTRVSKQKTILL